MGIWFRKNLSIFNFKGFGKFILKIVFLISLVVFCLEVSKDLFIKKNLNYFSRVTFDENIKHVDIAIFGTSHGYSTFDPRVFEKKIKAPTYNFSMAAQRLTSMSPLVDDVIRAYDIKLAIIDVFHLSTDTLATVKSKTLQYETLDQVNFSANKLMKHNEIFGTSNIFDIFPTVRNHSGWKSFLEPEEPYVVPIDRDFYKGFRPYFGLNEEHWNEYVEKYKWRKKNFKIDKESRLSELRKLKYLDIIKKFEKNNIKVLFTSAPLYKKALKPMHWEHLFAVNNFLDSLKIPFIDYNLLYDRLKLKKEHFKDPTHLNTNGALIVSTHLSKYVARNYGFLKDIKSTTPDFKKNRYALLSTKNKDVLYQKFFDEKKIRDSVGIKKVLLYKVSDCRYELLIQGRKKLLNGKRYRFRFKFPENEADRILDVKNISHDYGGMAYKGGFDNWIQHQGNFYHALQFNASFEEINNIQLIVDPRIKIFEKDTLKLVKSP